MNIPGFTADLSLDRSATSYANDGYYRKQSTDSHADTVVPAIPPCENCDFILENCEQNGWRPKGLCNLCATGNCFSGVENPPPSVPFDFIPWQW
ncbi:MAG: hypothetical protein Fur006_23510 [Coleofasciculaceae cyanobacterium]